MFDVKTDEGIVTGRVNGRYMDAAVAGTTAGLEFSVDQARCSDSSEPRQAPCVMTLDMHPVQLLQLASTILTALDLPSFNANEWNTVAAALREYDGLALGDVDVLKMADLIDTAAAKIEALYKAPVEIVLTAAQYESLALGQTVNVRVMNDERTFTLMSHMFDKEDGWKLIENGTGAVVNAFAAIGEEATADNVEVKVKRQVISPATYLNR